jgi:hypothetical protein
MLAVSGEAVDLRRWPGSATPANQVIGFFMVTVAAKGLPFCS